MNRPYERHGIEVLERLFEISQNDPDELALIEGELRHRTTSKAQQLHKKVLNVLTKDTSINKASQQKLDLNDALHNTLKTVPSDLADAVPQFIKPAAAPSLPASAKKVTTSAASTSEQSQKLPHTDMDLLTACRTLNVKAEANWSLIEAARSQLVNLSNPVTLKALDSLEKEKRVENAKQANVAFAALLKNRLF
jgi:hypothetical protein